MFKKEWKAVSAFALAQAVFEVVEGDCSLLAESCKPETSIWQQISSKTLKSVANGRDRFWMQVTWLKNSGNVQDIHQGICATRNAKHVPMEKDGDVEEQEQVCICGAPETDVLQDSMIQCCKCNIWYHGTCIKVDPQKHEGPKRWVCGSCTGGWKADKVPPIVLETRKKLPKLTERFKGQPPSVKHLQLKVTEDVTTEEHVPIAAEKNTAEEILQTDVRHLQEPELPTSPMPNVPGVQPKRKYFPSTFSAHRSVPSESDDIDQSLNDDNLSDIEHDFVERPKQRYFPDLTPPTETGDMHKTDLNVDDVAPLDTHMEDIMIDPSLPLRDSYQQDETEQSTHNYDSENSQDGFKDQSQDKDVDVNENSPSTVEPTHSGCGDISSCEPGQSDGQTSSNKESESTSSTDEVGFDKEGTHKKFCIIIPKNDWKVIRPDGKSNKNTARGHEYRLAPGVWTNVFNDAFLKSCTSNMKGCVLKFLYHHIVPEKGSKDSKAMFYFTCKAKCTRPECSMEYMMRMIDKPAKDAFVQVVPSGKLKHDLAKIAKRQLRGSTRTYMKEQLKHVKPSILKRRVYAEKSSEDQMLLKGNLTVPQTLPVLHKVRSEILAQDDLDPDVLTDLILRKKRMIEEDKALPKPPKLKGYIQDIQADPFVVSFFMDASLSILRRLLKWNPTAVLHIDSTGRIAASTPTDRDKKQFYYAIVVNLPGGGQKEAPLVPVMEFVANCQSTSEIQKALKSYFDKFRQYTDNFHGFQGIQRIETDYSVALMSACVEALGYKDIGEYTIIAWNCLNSNRKINYVHHICRAHAIRFIEENIKKNFTRNEDSVNVFTTWMHGFLFGDNLWDFYKSVREAIIICGKKFYVKEVEEALKYLKLAPRRNDSEDPPWTFMKDSQSQGNGPLYMISPFGMLALRLCKKLNIKIPEELASARNWSASESSSEDSADEAAASNGIKNPHYSPTFLLYLMRYIFPYGCFLTHSLIKLIKGDTTEDTNACSESWNATLKRDEKIHNLRIGRLAVALRGINKGGLAMFDLALKRLELEKSRKSKSRNAPTAAPENVNKSIDPDYPWNSSEHWKRKSSKHPSETRSAFHSVALIPYGGEVVFRGSTLKVLNTCNIDNQLQIFYTLFRLHQSVGQFLRQLQESENLTAGIILRIFASLDVRNFSQAREITLFQLMRLQPTIDEELKAWNLFESEDRFLDALSDLVKIKQNVECTNLSCNIAGESIITFSQGLVIRSPREFEETFNNRQVSSTCEGCRKGKSSTWYSWLRAGPPLILPYCIANWFSSNVDEQMIPTSQTLLGEKYLVRAYTVQLRDHFTTVFLQGSKRYVYDGLASGGLKRYEAAPTGHKISTVWLMKD